MIDVDHLIFEYPGLRALDDVSLHIPPGGITALVGPNGAGKTTLLRCLAALELPVSGSIVVNGVDVLEHPRLCHRSVGYLSDFFGLYERLTVRQSLHYVARAQGLPEIDCAAAIADVSSRLHIQDRLQQRPGELSRGLRQRVAIAQAIIHAPRVLMLDEPASGLDPEARHELEQLFINLQQRGMTLLVSSHILAELENYCTDMLVIRAGRVVEQTPIKPRGLGKTLRLVVAAPMPDLAGILQSLDGIGVLQAGAQQALLAVPDDSQAQHALLQQLIARGVPVCEFAAATNNLQDTYLKTIRQSL